MLKLYFIILIFGIVVLSIFNVGCHKEIPESNIDPTSISIKSTGGIYSPGGTTNLLVTINPGNANQNYSLSIVGGIDNATLTNNVLTAKNNGITIVKAVTANGKQSDTCAIVISNQHESENTLVIKDTIINNKLSGRVPILIFQPTYPLLVIFKNNRITAKNSNEHIVLFGNETSGSSDHMLDNIIITGNYITWTGTDLSDANEGILVGYSINATIKYNLIQNCPYGTPTKSKGFTYTSGGIAYNIYTSSFKVGAGAKGLNGVKFYNNTFYNTRNTEDGVIGSIYINSNVSEAGSPPSTNCEIYNNIFYTKHQVANIFCDSASLQGLKCDYNLYYCEDGEPVFQIDRRSITFSEWQNMGYDTHSVVMNPNFTDYTSLVPSASLNYGKSLDSTWQYGLDISTRWDGTEVIVKPQGSAWQVGAYVR